MPGWTFATTRCTGARCSGCIPSIKYLVANCVHLTASSCLQLKNGLDLKLSEGVWYLMAFIQRRTVHLTACLCLQLKNGLDLKVAARSLAMAPYDYRGDHALHDWRSWTAYWGGRISLASICLQQAFPKDMCACFPYLFYSCLPAVCQPATVSVTAQLPCAEGHLCFVLWTCFVDLQSFLQDMSAPWNNVLYPSL